MDDEIDSNDEMDKVSRDSIDDEITGVPTQILWLNRPLMAL